MLNGDRLYSWPSLASRIPDAAEIPLDSIRGELQTRRAEGNFGGSKNAE